MENSNNQSLKDKLALIGQKLAEYTSTKHITPDNQIDSEELNRIMRMDRKDLRALSEEDCGEIAFLLNRLSLEIQREINIQSATEAWAMSEVNKAIAGRVADYKGYGDEKKFAAIKDNTYASQAYDVKTHAEMRVKSLNYLAQEIKNMANTILDIKRTKRKFDGTA